MEQAEIEALITHIDARTKRIEQTFATKDDLQALTVDVLEEGERTRRRFDVVADDMKAQIAVIAGWRQAETAVDSLLTSDS